MDASFDDSLLRRLGLEFNATLPCGHVVWYLSRETARVYAKLRGAEITGPQHGPFPQNKDT
jgi:hypothetical protein